MNFGDLSVLVSVITGLIAIPFAASTITISDDYIYGISAVLNSTPELISNYSDSIPGFSSKTISDELIEYVYQTPHGKFVIRMYDGKFETTLTNIGRKVSSVQSPEGQVWMLQLPTESLVINQTNQKISEIYKNLDGYIEVVKEGGSVFTTTRGTASEASLQEGMLKLENDLNYSIALIKNMTSYILNTTAAQPPVQQNTVVINEFESNPNGTDTGNEWIELYNPTAEVVNISNWKLFNSKYESITIPLNTTVQSNDYYVVDNLDFLINTNEKIILKNNGEIIDETPAKSDGYNDGRCWARVPNGYDSNSDSDWKFQVCTKGIWNG